MDFSELVKDAISMLTLNKLRTGLAILGIVIGIGSVIALISLGQGSQKQIENNINSLGANLITVQPGSQSSGPVAGAGGGGTTLTLEDAEAIETSPSITTVNNVSPEYSGRTQVVAGRNNINSQVIGVTADYASIRKIEVESGQFITDADTAGMRKVAVIGPTAAEELFGAGVNPLGQKIRANGQTLTIVGVTVSKGGTGFNNSDDSLYVPLSTAQKLLFGATHLTTIAVEAKSQDVMVQAQDEIGYLLLDRHNLKTPEDADFRFFSQADILSTASSVTGTFTALLGGIAAISLLVGGIGIMNIMLVTVTERTREIGLRKALGATRKLITTQFLVESIILTFAGGLIGMLLGIATAYGISAVMSIPFTISFSSIALAIGVSGGIGILFGWYPAQKAAKLQPIEALRYE